MSLTIPVVIAGLIGLSAISMLLAVPNVRSRLVGASNVRNALVPLVTAAFLWSVAAFGDFLKGRLEESTIPADVLYLHVQDIEFGLPKIPTEYLDHDYTGPQIKRALSPLTTIDSNVALSDDEIDRVNAISASSGMVDDIGKGKVYTTKDIANFATQPLLYTYNYVDWSRTALAWANLLEGFQSAEKAEGLRKFIDTIETQKTAPGLFQGMIGMSSRGQLPIVEIKGDCLAARSEMVSVEEIENYMYLTFPRFRTALVGLNAIESRRQAAKQFAHLLQFGCFSSIAKSFRAASAIFGKEAETMRKYIEEINRILASKQSEAIRIRVALSNIGRFDSFVRNTAKVAVGPIGSLDPISLTATSSVTAGKKSDNDEEDAPQQSPDFVEVKSRSNVTITLIARLNADMQNKLYGAYQSEQAYLRLAVLASAGSSESLVLSPASPFSSKAKAAFDRMIENAVVPIKQ